MNGKRLAVLGFAVFVLSWFFDAHEALKAQREVEDVLGRFSRAMEVSAREGESFMKGRVSPAGGPPGWRAARAAWDLLDPDETPPGAKRWKTVWLGLTPLTNLVMLAAFAFVLGGVAPIACGVALLLCAVGNAGWMYLVGDQGMIRDGLAAGYYLWVLSFAIAGIGALGSARR